MLPDGKLAGAGGTSQYAVTQPLLLFLALPASPARVPGH